jgi:PAS domain S-box-containing protein
MFPPGPSSGSRILVLHPHGADALVERLTALGYLASATTASGDAISRPVAAMRPDVVLIDLALPDAGLTAGRIRREFSTPCTFLARPGDEQTLAAIGITGPFGYVLEPYPDRELRMNIEMALTAQRMQTQEYALEDRFFAVNLDMLCCLDFNGYFRRLNPAWERTLGFSRQELMSRPFIEFVHPDDRARTLEQNRDVRGGGRALGFENRYLCKDGSYRWFLWNAAPDFDQRVIYSVARDITERKRADEEREALVAELQAALAEVRSLQSILPICSYCKRIRDDANYWRSVEAYISEHTNATFSHGICPACYTTQVEPELRDISEAADRRNSRPAE